MSNSEFDVVAAIFTQFLTPDERRQVFAGMRNALKPGGLPLLIEGYRPEQFELQDRWAVVGGKPLYARCLKQNLTACPRCKLPNTTA